MKTIFRKALTVLGSAAMIGATIGAAAAATYPEPFTSNTAIVVGANAAPSDSIAASSIAAKLDAASAGSMMTTGTTTVEGGDSYKFEKTSTKYHLGDNITQVITSTLDDDEMPILLADGKYIDDDNDEFDYTQTVTVGSNLQLGMFEDNDYKADTPTVGFRIPSGETVLTYTLTFNDEPVVADTPTTDLMLMGKNYYVLSFAGSTLTLLDSASDAIVAEGETQTITAGGKTYNIGIEYIGETSVKLKVNGETTNSLSAANTYKLSDGSYVGVKEILYSAKDTGISKVEFSIGNGKLVLTSGSDVELNEDAINGLTATITNTTSLTSIAIAWTADDELFITKDSSVVMPGFEALQLAFGGMTFPAEEEIMISNSGDDAIVLDNFPLKDSTEDIAVLYADGTNFVGIGKDADELLRTDNDGSITFDGDTDSYFVASYSDGRDAESYLMRATNFREEDSINKTTFQYRDDGVWTDAKVDRQSGDTFSVGNVELAVGVVNRLGKSVVITNNSVETNFHMLYSAEGLAVYLPVDEGVTAATGEINITAGSPTAFNLTFVEEDKDGDKLQGKTIRTLLGLNSQSPAEVQVASYTSTGTLAGQQEIGNTDVFQDFVFGDLATEILHDKGPDQKTLTLVYHGEEAAAAVYITSSDAVIGGGSESGVMTVLDNAVNTVAGKNLVVVGGSAINSVAAELLGGAYSEAQFTSMTGVGTGSFLIQSFDRAGKTALLVAGYNAADTTKAATYLINEGASTVVGKKLVGTSATEATVVTA
jgi:hypothetical protein